MYLSDRDLRAAIESGALIVEPPAGVSAAKIDPTSIDLRLDHVREAKVWDVHALSRRNAIAGFNEPLVRLGKFKYPEFAEEYLIPPANYDEKCQNNKVFINGDSVLVKPGGFLLWQTKEKIGTPAENPAHICFIDGKSTRARTGILVHLTAPTIHAGWSGKVVLEIVNTGPFTFDLRENDVIAQLTVATISSCPLQSHITAGSSTIAQVHVSGRPNE
jgi:dCTP deaminase